jgi:hypothetical protein
MQLDKPEKRDEDHDAVSGMKWHNLNNVALGGYLNTLSFYSVDKSLIFKKWFLMLFMKCLEYILL